jgi:hypothetical protein
LDSSSSGRMIDIKASARHTGVMDHQQGPAMNSTSTATIARPTIEEKSEIINWLASQNGYTSYLEVATETTGFQFGRIDRQAFTVVERLLYRTPENFDDGLKLDYRCESEDNSATFAQLRRQGKRYDIVFVDSFHTYECSARDLENAIALLNDRGTLVVHDCDPPTRNLVVPDYRPNTPWCGVSYIAFLDFVYRRHDLEFSVVDTDYGVGVVRRKRARGLKSSRDIQLKDAQLKRDVITPGRHRDWDCYTAHRKELLHLISVAEFLNRYQCAESFLARWLAWGRRSQPGARAQQRSA